ncbi:MAG: methyltransferase [Candidatus Aminicenantes bacterium]|nr:methyltransferase [Candidatus Aminicenantes bacterium]
MTRRERVLSAIAHREPDKVPMDLGGMRSTGITALAYGRLKKYLGMSGGSIDVYDVIQQLAQPEDPILDFFDADVIDLGRAFLTAAEDWKDFVLPDGSPAKIPAFLKVESDGAGGYLARSEDGTVIGAMPKGAFYLTQTHYPLLEWDGKDLSILNRLTELMDKVTWAALPTAPGHKPLTPGHLAEIKRRAKRLYETTDFAIMAGFGGNLLEWGQFLCRNDQFLADLIENPRKTEALLDKLTEIHIANLEKFLDAVEGYVQIIQMGDDLGTQLAPQISPRMYRRFFKPRHKLIYERIRRRTGVHLFLHSCGAIAELLPDLIEVGVEIINPVQTSARGMEPDRLKREFGKDVTFWGGGCDTQRVLPHGTEKEIDEHVRRRIEILAPGGGFVFAQVHNIMPNVPPQNIVAMVEAAKTYRTRYEPSGP